MTADNAADKDKKKGDKDAEEKEKKEKEKAEKPEEPKLTPKEQLSKDLMSQIRLLQQAATTKDPALTARVMRSLVPIRKQLRFIDVITGIANKWQMRDPFMLLVPVSKELLANEKRREEEYVREQEALRVEKERAEEERKKKEQEKEAMRRANKEKFSKPQKGGKAAAEDKDSKDKDKSAAAAAGKDKDSKDKADKPKDAKAGDKAGKAADKDVEMSDANAKDAKDKKADAPAATPVDDKGPAVPEVEAYLWLLVTVVLIDNKFKEQAAACTVAMLQFLSKHNRRTLDSISAKAYYFYSLTHERLGKAQDIQSALLLAHRTAALRHDEPSQAVLINCILRNYIQAQLYAQADKFQLACHFPENRTNAQHSRFLYYVGKIQSVQLSYSDAYSSLNQAIRRAPTAALGFQQAANKLFIIVQLLMGDIPDRTVFHQKGLKRSLVPYLQLTRAVRVGNLAAFQRCVSTHEAVFTRDKTLSLIARLRHNVIKTGLRRICTSYSRISIRDICTKLHLESEEDAESIIAKAIYDGVIEAVIDCKQRFVFSKENIDVYSSAEPQLTFHKRIQFCLDIHNSAVKDMRFPPDAHKPKAVLQRPEDDDDEINEDNLPAPDKDDD